MSFAPRRILVATDFSTFASAAADAAIALARRFDARVTLLHAIPLSAFAVFSTGDAPGFDTAEMEEAVRAAAAKSGAAELTRLLASNVPVDVATVDGPPPAEICAYAAAQGFDLIVIGSHGRTGLQRLLLGSVAERVVRHASVPVLVVRQNSVSNHPPMPVSTLP